MQRPHSIIVTTWLVGILNVLGIFLAEWLLPDPGEAFAAGVVVILLGTGAVFCYWKGLNWGRWIVLLESFWCLWNVKYIRNEDATSLDVTMMIAAALLALFFLVYLNTKPVRTWFERTL
jgi:hypothetical protein